VRHPIYSGILLALLGTALATDLYFLIVLALMGPYFIHQRARRGAADGSRVPRRLREL